MAALRSESAKLNAARWLTLAMLAVCGVHRADAQRSAVPLTEFAASHADSAIEPDGTTPLHRAILGGDNRLVAHLLRRGADAGATTRYGVTPLALAVLGGHLDIVDALLAAGARPDSVVGEGETLLMIAARTGHQAIVERLLARGANPNALERWRGQTALMLAAGNSHAGVVTALVRRGANPNAVSDTLEFWSMVPSEPATPKIAMARGGMTALHYAARQGARESVAALAAAPGVELNLPDPDGVTPLLYATLNGHFDIAADLLEAGADPNAADSFGRTVLFSAVHMNRPDREPRAPARTDDATTPLALAALALSKGAKVDSRITGRIPNRCSQGCQPAGLEGATPLWRAARSGDVVAVRLLLNAGADPAIAARDGSTAAMMAAGMSWRDDRALASDDESVEVLQLLIARGIDLNGANAAGETALHGAAARGSSRVIRFLADAGADLRSKDKTNRLPLHAAMGISDQPLRIGGGAAMSMPVRESAVRTIEELMHTKNIPIEPYTRGAAAAPPPSRQGY